MKTKLITGAILVVVSSVAVFFLLKETAIPVADTEISKNDILNSTKRETSPRLNTPVVSAYVVKPIVAKAPFEVPTSSVAVAHGNGTVKFIPGKKTPAEVAAMENEKMLKRMEKVDKDYTELYISLNFDQKQKDSLIRLKVQQEQDRLRLERAVILRTLDDHEARSVQIAQARDEVYSKFMTELTEIYGESTAATIRNYEAAASLGYIINRAADSLASAGNPLTDSQTKALTLSVAQNSLNPSGRPESSALNVEKVTAEISPLLSAQQKAIFYELARGGTLSAPLSLKDKK